VWVSNKSIHQSKPRLQVTNARDNTFWLSFPSMSRDNSISIERSYGLNDRGSIPSMSKKFVSSPVSKPALEPTQTTLQYLSVVVSLGLKRPGREADRIPPSTAEIMNGGVTPPHPHTSPWRRALLIKHRDNFTFPLLFCLFFSALFNRAYSS
jgi:hypothetical protein